MRILLLFIILPFTLFSTGCNDVPKCDDKEVKVVVQDLLEQHLQKLLISDATIDIDLIRTVSKNKTDCQCTAVVEINSKSLGLLTEQIAYKVEIPDKKDGTFIVIID